jgi:serine/threonine-protein kinase RsbT
MEPIKYTYDVPGNDFSRAGHASADLKKKLKVMGVDPEKIRNIAIALYEGEINLVIHGGGGIITVLIYPHRVEMYLDDDGPGIADIEMAMQEGYSGANEAVRDLGFGAGMGLPNMKKYSDTLEIESELNRGTHVKMTVCI